MDNPGEFPHMAGSPRLFAKMARELTGGLSNGHVNGKWWVTSEPASGEAGSSRTRATCRSSARGSRSRGGADIRGLLDTSTRVETSAFPRSEGAPASRRLVRRRPAPASWVGERAATGTRSQPHFHTCHHFFSCTTSSRCPHDSGLAVLRAAARSSQRSRSRRARAASPSSS